MSAFADYGFGIEPTQLICGWIEESRRTAPISAPDSVEYKGSNTQKTFNHAAGNAAGKRDTNES
jgi:hypothetical protein